MPTARTTAEYIIQVTNPGGGGEETLTIIRSSFADTGGPYDWYTWNATTSNSQSISGKGEIYSTTVASMQFNKGSGKKVAALYNTTAIPGTITKIEATTASGTNRGWNAYVSTTAAAGSDTTLTFGNNNTQIGTSVTVGTTSTTIGTSNHGYSYFCIQEAVTGASYLSEIKITFTPSGSTPPAPTLSSIAVKTAPTTTTYTAGDYFNPAGLVITLTYSDSSTVDVAYSGHESDFTFDPALDEALTTGDTEVTITYGGKDTTQAITVNSGGGGPVLVQKTATLTFTSACGGSGTDDKGNVWTVTSDAAESNYDGTKAN